jgi:3-deoxy-manno-octulosonate cytidylyltransferase (CMP-KDO synthetase)
MDRIQQARIQSQSTPGRTTGPHVDFPPGGSNLAGAVNSSIVIPARLASTRLPRKLLLAETGKPLIQHTYEAAQRAQRPQSVCVAADCEEIAAAVRSFGGEVILTSPACASGTDRIAEVAAHWNAVDILVNVQGDEPDLSGDSIDLVVELLQQNPTVQMATLATPIRTLEKLHDPACVKVVIAPKSTAENIHLNSNSEPGCPQPGAPSSPPTTAYRALYFSRAAIPHARDWHDNLLSAQPPCFLQHLGLYAYRRDFLIHLARLPRSPLERLENLEQLRALENGYEILVGIVDEPSIGIDTPADYAAFVERYRSHR